MAKKKLVLYETLKQKLAFIKREGSILTFLEKPSHFDRTQILITRISKRKNGQIKLIGMFGIETGWFESMDELISLVDWETMDDWHQFDSKMRN